MSVRKIQETMSHSGASFDSFLEKEGIREEVELVAIKRVLAWPKETSMHKREILKLYRNAELADIPDRRQLLLICVNRTVQDQKLSLYDAVRYSWKVSPDKANHRLVLAVAFGLILGVFEADEWLKATKQNFEKEISDHHGNWQNQEGRFGFRGRPAPEVIAKHYLYKRVPDELRNHGAALRYVG